MTHPRFGSPRFGALLARSAVSAALIATITLPTLRADAAEQPAPPARSLAVSVPPDPVELEPDKSAVVSIRITNPGTAPVQVNIASRGLTLGDEGQVTIADTADPQWGDRVEFPPGPYTIAAQGTHDLAVTVHPPPNLPPDLYFVGFLVTPIPGAANAVTVINQIGGFFTLDVPGPRNRHVDASLHLPGWSIGGLRLVAGSNINGTLHVANTGQAAVRLWGETDTNRTGGGPTQNQIPKSLVPTGRTRTFTFKSKPAWPIGIVTTTIRIVYPTETETTTTEIVLTRKVLVVRPIAVAAIAALAALGIWLLARSRKRRRPPQRHTAQPQRDAPTTMRPRPRVRPIPLDQR